MQIFHAALGSLLNVCTKKDRKWQTPKLVLLTPVWVKVVSGSKEDQLTTTCFNTRRYGQHKRGDVSPPNFCFSEECEGHQGGKIFPQQSFLLAACPHPRCPGLLAFCANTPKLATRGKGSSSRRSDPAAYD